MKARSVLLVLVCLLATPSFALAISQPFDEPAVVLAVAPLFPLLADGSYALGSVIVEVQINAAGVVTAAQAVQGHPFLYAPTEKAARRWLFAAQTEGTKVRTVRLTFVFKLMADYRTPDEDLSPIFMPPFKIEVRRKVSVVIHDQS